jgi:uncharacterized protein YndB with AHSA1/START domain
MAVMAHNGKAFTTKKLFSRETSVGIEINANKSIVWALLTNASDYPRWSSTVLSIDGEIKLGSKIRLKSSLDPKRVFTLSVKEWETDQKLVWGDSMGRREYILSTGSGGNTLFTMTEKIGGPLFPLFSRMIPSFDESFEQFAKDLKQEAEIISNAR